MASLDKFFALSTCIHCRHTKEFFDEHNVSYSLIYVDKAKGDERETILEEMGRYNPQLSFPTLVFSNGQVIIGFQPDAISQELDL